MTRSSRRLLALAGVTALALSGCGSTARAGAAAVVGDDRISSDRLQQVVSRGLADPAAQQGPGADKPAFTRSVLLRLIQHDILLRAAKQEGVSIDNAAIDATQDRIAAQLGGLPQLRAEAVKAGIAPGDLRQTLADVALRDALADKLTAGADVPPAQLKAAYQSQIAQYDQVHSAHILVKTQAEANALLAQVKADPARFGDLAKQRSLDTGSKDQGGDLGFQGRGALAKPFEEAIFGNPPGSFVVAKTQFGFHVIHVIERKTTTLEQATPDLRRGLLSQQRQDAVNALLSKTAKQLGVHVNPRFGRWDAKALDVVAAPDTVSKPDTTGATPSSAPGQ